MSGGSFDYKQHHIRNIADDIEAVIEKNTERDDPFDKKTIARFHEGVKALRIAERYAHRIDYLLSDDYSEETFHARLTSDLKEIK